jgi:hypothetical protein
MVSGTIQGGRGAFWRIDEYWGSQDVWNSKSGKITSIEWKGIKILVKTTYLVDDRYCGEWGPILHELVNLQRCGVIRVVISRRIG